LRKQVIKSQKQTKLNALVAKALYAPTWYAETMDKLNNESATFEYIRVAYDSIPDTEIKLTDADFEAYIKENEKKFTNKEEVRNLEYVVFEVKPTLEDSLAIKTNMDSLASGFASTTNDSLFAASNNGFYGMNYQKKDEFPGNLKDNVASMNKGSIYGPYIDNGGYLVAKLIDKKVIADSAKASHILRSVANGDPVQLAAANKYIDSLKNAIQSGATTFADAATNNSQDPGSAQSGGELGTFAPGAMVQPFNDAVFNGKEGSLYTVTTQFGVHLIKVEKLIYETNDMKYNVAFISQPIVASEATQNAIESKVMELLESTKTLEDLAKAATGDVKVETAGGVKKNDYILGVLGSEQTSRDIIRWAFEDAEEGKVSPTLYTYSDNVNYVDSKHVIVGLKSVDKPGLATVAAVKASIEAKVKNAKKAALIKSKIQGNDLNAVASTFNETVKSAENVYFGGAFIPDAGQEPLLIGKVFGVNAGTTVGPVDGVTGVYVAKLIAKSSASTEAGSFGTKAQLTQAARMQVNFRLMDSLKKQYEVEDNRFTFY
jgi:peptidyl-prolyl cis-trans isomerase D